MNVFVFDIETIPDVQAGRQIFDLDGLDDEAAGQAMTAKCLQKRGTEFQPLHLHQVVAISAVFRSDSQLQVWSLGTEQSDEKELIQRFFDGIERYTPTLVSWNGGGFDLPVLHYRALLHGVSAPRYWDTGEDDQSFKWNNYLSRYHQRHLDLMDFMAMYNNRAYAPLDQIASMLGFPGKMGMSGARVWDEFQAGNIKGIRDYCETDVLNTYLVYLRFELIRGHLHQQSYEQELDRVSELLAQSSEQHLQSFLQTWQKS